MSKRVKRGKLLTGDAAAQAPRAAASMLIASMHLVTLPTRLQIACCAAGLRECNFTEIGNAPSSPGNSLTRFASIGYNGALLNLRISTLCRTVFSGQVMPAYQGPKLNIIR